MLDKKSPRVEIAVIGGWLAWELLASGALTGHRHGRVDTPFGGSQPIFMMAAGDVPYYFLSRHGERAYSVGASFVNYRANIYALKELGVKAIVAWTGCAAVNPDAEIGQLAVISDVIDETRRREGTFMRFRGIGLLRQHTPFCPTVRRELIDALTAAKANFADHGVYLCTEGPRLETAAEARKYARDGADAIGMTLVPEAFLARELEMCYASLGLAVRHAEGMRERRHRPGELYEGLATRSEELAAEKTLHTLPGILSETIESLRQTRRICQCQESMKRYKKMGDIGDDWHEWLKP